MFPRLAIDVSNFQAAPLATGIQRLQRGLFEQWPVRHVEPVPFYLTADGDIHLVDFEMVLDATQVVFEASDGLAAARRGLRDGVVARLPVEAFDVIADGYLLSEPTGRRGILDVAERWSRRAPSTCFAILHDALPLTHPRYFTRDDAETSRYFRWVARQPNVLSNSERTERALVRLTRGLRGPNWTVAAPGADALDRSRGRRAFVPTFVALGTIEPRKGIDVVLDAFERLWQQGHPYHLQVVGRRGWADAELCDRLERMHGDPTCRVEWLLEATDAELEVLIGESWGVVYASELEGFGLPPLEALWAGRPVVVSDALPAVAGLAPAAAIRRLDAMTASSIARAVADLVAVRPVVDPDLELPTWAQFGDAVRRWLADGFSKAGESVASADRA